VSRPRLAVLASGRGSNLSAIAAACNAGQIDAELALVLCNVPGAGALELAASLGIENRCIDHRNYAERADFDAALLEALRESAIEFVALAGFMRILGEPFVRQYCGSLLNINPSLLPKYPGLHTHRRAIEAGDREAGATVHFVTPTLDAGPAILQARVPILSGDDPQTLAGRVLELEHRIYPQALAWCVEGRVKLQDGKAWMEGEVISDHGGVRFESND